MYNTMTNSNLRRITAIIVLLCLIITCTFASAPVSNAKTDTATVPDKLKVTIYYSDGTTPISTTAFEKSDMSEFTTPLKYSYQDNLPTFCYASVSKGIKFKDLILNCKLTESDVKAFRFQCTDFEDGYDKTIAKDTIMKTGWYYPDLSTVGWSTKEDGTLYFTEDAAKKINATKTTVEPVLAFEYKWYRLTNGQDTDAAVLQDVDNRFRLLTGAPEDFITNTTVNAPDSLRWISEVGIITTKTAPSSGSSTGSAGSTTGNTNTTDGTAAAASDQESEVNSLPIPDISSVKGQLSDISGHWAEDYIYKMAALGTVTGYTDGTFNPGGYVTRAEFTTMLVKSLIKTGNAVLVDTHLFGDTMGHWAKKYISTAVQMGIASGKRDSKFEPDAPITRQEMAVMIANAMKFSDPSYEITAADADQIASWALESVKGVCSKGIMSVGNDGLFRPLDKTTRAEAATVLYRSLVSAGYLK